MHVLPHDTRFRLLPSPSPLVLLPAGSEVTGALLVHDMGLSAQYVQVLPYDTAVTIEGVKVTMLTANHCPGAVMLLFEVGPALLGTACSRGGPTTPVYSLGCLFDDPLRQPLPRRCDAAI